MSAAALAKKGRYGDTHVAHLASGERIVPPVISPELQSALDAELSRAGIDPSAYVVGSPEASINPETGMQEFGFLKGIFKPIKNVITKVFDDIVPNELKPVLPLLAAATGNPGLAALINAGNSIGNGGSGLQGLLSGAGGYFGAGGTVGGQTLGNVIGGATGLTGDVLNAATGAVAGGLSGAGQGVKGVLPGAVVGGAAGYFDPLGTMNGGDGSNSWFGGGNAEAAPPPTPWQAASDWSLGETPGQFSSFLGGAGAGAGGGATLGSGGYGADFSLGDPTILGTGSVAVPATSDVGSSTLLGRIGSSLLSGAGSALPALALSGVLGTQGINKTEDALLGGQQDAADLLKPYADLAGEYTQQIKDLTGQLQGADYTGKLADEAATLANADYTGQIARDVASGDLGGKFTEQDFAADPGYQFRLQEGQKALERVLSSSGLGQSGAAIRRAMELNQNLASDEYSNAWNRWMGEQGNRYNILSDQQGNYQNVVAGGEDALSKLLTGQQDLGTGATTGLANILSGQGATKALSATQKTNLLTQLLAKFLSGSGDNSFLNAMA